MSAGRNATRYISTILQGRNHSHRGYSPVGEGRDQRTATTEWRQPRSPVYSASPSLTRASTIATPTSSTNPCPCATAPNALNPAKTTPTKSTRTTGPPRQRRRTPSTAPCSTATPSPSASRSSPHGLSETSQRKDARRCRCGKWEISFTPTSTRF